jgi:hypothetical protein
MALKYLAVSEATLLVYKASFRQLDLMPLQVAQGRLSSSNQSAYCCRISGACPGVKQG